MLGYGVHLSSSLVHTAPANVLSTWENKMAVMADTHQFSHLAKNSSPVVDISVV